MDTAWTRVAETLNDIDFPAGKDELFAHAQDRDADPETLKLLRGLPLATYRNISEIRSSVPLDPAEDDGQTASERASRARSSHDRIAEHLRES